MRPKLHTALRLSANDWWMLIQAWTWLFAVDVGMRLLPFKRVQVLMEPGRETEVLPAGEAEAVIQRLAWLVGIAGRHHLYRMRCLPRSLVLQRLLRLQGISSDLRIGVQHREAGLVAHAWLEYQGQPLGQPEDIASRFTPLVSASAGQ